jgi:chaperonin GroEL
MAHKQILFRSAAREKVLPGATQLADAVRVTLGPRSNAVLIEKTWAVTEVEAKCEGDEKMGVLILKRALEAPTRQIADNSTVDGGVVVTRMLSGNGHEVFDAGRKEYVDLIEAGIIDPTKIVRIAHENAMSVASVLSLTEATMTEIREVNKDRSPEPQMAM